MKKIAALFLSFVMLTMLLPAGVAVTAEGVEKESFYFVNISNSQSDSPYIFSMPQFWARNITAETKEPYVAWNDNDTIESLTQAAKADFNSRPKGTRYINFTLLSKAFKPLAENAIYMEKGVEMVRAWLEEFLSAYHKIGGELDGLIVDLEYNYVLNYYIAQIYDGTTSAYPKNKNIYNDIVNDPRYATDVRPMLEEWGFDFYDNVGGEKSEIFSIYPRLKEPELSRYAKSREIWDTVMEHRLSNYITEAVYDPLVKYYPDAIVSDYKRADMDNWLKPMHNYGRVLGNRIKAGNASNYNMYSYAPSLTFFESSGKPVYKKIPSYNHAVYGSTPYKMTLYNVNSFKNVYNSTDNGIVNAWVAEYAHNDDFMPDFEGTHSGTPYYTETLFHIGLLDPQPFIGYIVPTRVDVGYEGCIQVAADIMAELTRVAGYADRKPIAMPANWNGRYILSGMYAGGRNIWRFTPDTDIVSLKDVLVDSNTPTFSIDGQTVTFPQGKIIADGNVSKVGTCGYWIETPADVTPVVTSTADRYRENPSLLEDFEQYPANSAFTSATALPKTTWEVTGNMTVQAHGSGKALAMTGTAAMKNVKLPQNITAGDNYAKQQAWEVTFTLPEGLAANAELNLLHFGNTDGGIKISGGKVFCASSSGYQTLPDVNLSAGTYTVKRELDFRTAGAYNSDYYIYDDAGNLLSQLQDVAIASFALPVTTISLSCTGVDKTVYIDDYKLYPTGVTTDFEIYDVAHGTMLTVGETRTEDTAYRLSWMNASAEHKTAYVYNELDGKILQKVDMAPGQDGVVTDIVELEDGKSVKLAVKTVTVDPPKSDDTSNGGSDTPDTPNAPDNGDGQQPDIPDNNQDVVDTTTTAPDENNVPQPTDDPTDPDEKQGLSGGVIAVIIVGAILVIATAVYLLAIQGKEAAILEKLKKIFKR